jgi:methyl-accepting chemotaxis protein
MEEIVDSIQRVTDIMGEIAAATQEQTAGIEQINQAIVQMDQVTQQNAALVEEAAAASEAMQEQAGQLAQTVGVFKIGGQVASARPAAPARALAQPKPVRPASPALVPNKPQSEAGTSVPAPRNRRTALPHKTGGDWEEF